MKLLQWHSTSRACDETVYLANIMKLDPGPVLGIPEEVLEARMAKLLQTVKQFPLLMIVQLPPRLRRNGFR
jgi:hypothetical protein